MLRNIYLVLLGLAALTAGFLWFFSAGWLGSIGDPQATSAAFAYYASVGWSFLWGSFVVLTVYSFILLVKENTKWPIWAGFAYFVIGLIGLLVNDNRYKSFLGANAISIETTLLNPFFVGVLIVVIVLALLVGQMLLGSKGKARKSNAETSEAKS